MGLSDLGYAVYLEASYCEFCTYAAGVLAQSDIAPVHPSIMRALYYVGHLVGTGRAPFTMSPTEARRYVAHIAHEHGGLPAHTALTLVLPCRDEATARLHDGLAWRRASA